VSDLNSNIEKLQNALAPFKNSGVLNQIGGKSVPAQSGSTFKSISPVDESVICEVALMNLLSAKLHKALLLI